jgi:hypothetical protein
MTGAATSLAQIIAINRRRIGLDPADNQLDDRYSVSTGATNRLCVYGRMRPGGPDAHVLQPLGGEWTEATFPGYLQDGSCSIDQCPGLAWTPSGDMNHGLILSSPGLQDAWHDLDAKEGSHLIRLLTPVFAGDTETVANIYVSRDATEAQLLMLDGLNVHDDKD